ncbi:MarR family winged helix-turn-helix transcriptional regulator [Bdellovibrio bacteriovorus]
MAKLFVQSLPSQEELHTSFQRLFEGADSKAMYSNLVFLKIATALENHFDNFLLPHNLSFGRFTVLALLSSTPEGIVPTELASRVGITQATMSGLLNGLEKAELIRREEHQNDRRSFLIKITDKGENLIKHILPQWAPEVAAFWNTFSQDEMNGMNQLMGKMIQNLSMLNKPQA